MNNINDFFNFDRPCPKEIENCKDLRDIYAQLKNELIKANCTICNINDLNYYFAKNVLKFQNKKLIKKIKTIKYKSIEKNNDFKIKKFTYKRNVIQESVIFKKDYIIIVDIKSKTTKRLKILFKLFLFNLNLYLCLSPANSFNFTFFVINRKKRSLLYYAKF
jgi:hypothetical protein